VKLPDDAHSDVVEPSKPRLLRVLGPGLITGAADDQSLSLFLAGLTRGRGYEDRARARAFAPSTRTGRGCPRANTARYLDRHGSIEPRCARHHGDFRGHSAHRAHRHRRKRRLAQACSAVLAFMHRHPISATWGRSDLASSDMMSMETSQPVFVARNDPRRLTPSVGIYSHTRDRWGISYAQAHAAQ
jgi:hypothetical protein